MRKSNMKRKMAAMLCMAMLCTAAAPAAHAEGWADLIAQGGEAFSQMLTESGIADMISEQIEQAGSPEALMQQVQQQIQNAPEAVQQIIEEVQKSGIPEALMQQFGQQTEKTAEPEQQPLVESITPPAANSEPDPVVVNEFRGANITPSNASKDTNSDGGVEGTVSFTGAKLYVTLYGPGDVVQYASVESDGGKFEFWGLAPGMYTLQFMFEGESELASRLTVEVGYDQSSTPSSVFYSATAKTKKVSTEGAKDGEVYGSAEFAGDKKLFAKLYKAADPNTQIAHYSMGKSGDSYSFTGLEPGDYYVKFFFDGEGSLPAQDEKYVTVAVDVSAGTTHYDPIQAKVTAASDTITVELTQASDGERLWVYVGNDAREIAKGAPVSFSGLAAGNYTVRINYEALGVGHSEYSFAQTVTLGSMGGSSAQYLPILAAVSSTIDSITVNVTQATDGQKLLATLNGAAPVEIVKGTPYTFTGLVNGTYDVSVNYAAAGTGLPPFYQTVNLEHSAAPTPTPIPTLSKIEITSVTPGENTLSIKGSAQANAQILVGADPAGAQAEVLLVKADGTFEANLAANPGTYTNVGVFYVADASTLVIKSGSWVVTAPAAKPALTVDTVDATSTTVIAQTAAGIIAELKTSDYSQKVTADAGGILRFSLPHTYGAGTKMTLTVYYGSNQSFAQEITVVTPPYPGTLEYGWEGDAVKKLTARLAALGYPVSETSRYGSTVREAVRLFQLANGLTADGVAGPETQRAIYSVSAIPYGSGKYPTLVRGDKGLSLIYTLQQRLKDLGYYTIKVDGIFGSGTQRAVRLFQQVNGLSVTGKADNATQTLLYSSSAKPASYGVSGDYSTLSRSSKYKSKVVPLQRRLKALGYYSGNIDGYFGSQTYRAVRNFQSRNGLTVTGVADPYTQQVLYSSAARPASGSSSSSSSSTGYRLLYWGCRGDAVTKLQQALIDAGYKSIVRKADGIFGQWTYDAVRAYQKDKGLAVDGIAGKNTQNALYGTSY